MTSREFRERLSDRAEKAGVSVTLAVQEQLESYYWLLARWNEKINLTALPLVRPTDLTFDRLFVEPLVAARHIPDSALSWFDLGSGGGSPAIPLKLAHPAATLTMVEVQARKSAFLREAVRTLGLSGTTVANDTVEKVSVATDAGSAGLITIRALRADKALFSAVEHLLAPTGRAILFHSRTAELAIPSSLEVVDTVHFRTSNSPVLSILRPMFHVEQRVRT